LYIDNINNFRNICCICSANDCFNQATPLILIFRSALYSTQPYIPFSLIFHSSLYSVQAHIPFRLIFRAASYSPVPLTLLLHKFTASPVILIQYHFSNIFNSSIQYDKRCNTHNYLQIRSPELPLKISIYIHFYTTYTLYLFYLLVFIYSFIAFFTLIHNLQMLYFS
jgi:hypothetical protein